MGDRAAPNVRPFTRTASVGDPLSLSRCAVQCNAPESRDNLHVGASGSRFEPTNSLTRASSWCPGLAGATGKRRAHAARGRRGLCRNPHSFDVRGPDGHGRGVLNLQPNLSRLPSRLASPHATCELSDRGAPSQVCPNQETAFVRWRPFHFGDCCDLTRLSAGIWPML